MAAASTTSGTTPAAAPRSAGSGDAKGDSGSSGGQPPIAPGGIELAAAKPGAIINTASLEGLPHHVYSMTVQGAKVYSGLYNGLIQVLYCHKAMRPLRRNTCSPDSLHL